MIENYIEDVTVKFVSPKKILEINYRNL